MAKQLEHRASSKSTPRGSLQGRIRYSGTGAAPGAVRSTDLQTNDDDDDDETISYVRPLLQLQTVTSVLMIRSDEQFSFQIATERGWKVAAT